MRPGAHSVARRLDATVHLGFLLVLGASVVRYQTWVGATTPPVEAGAAGYLLKELRPDGIYDALRAAAAGETVLSPPVASKLMRRFRAPGVALSPREIEILELLAAGRTNREISKVLFISEATVKTHLAHIYGKLSVDSRTAAVRAAVDRRLIRL